MGLSILAVSIGAVLGANLRWLLALWLNAAFPAIPPGTLLANWLGAWAIGLALGFFVYVPQLSPEWRLFVVTGFLGSLTTFSTFSAEMLANVQAEKWGAALVGIGLHVGGSLLMTGLGLATFAGLRAVLGGLR